LNGVSLQKEIRSTWKVKISGEENKFDEVV